MEILCFCAAVVVVAKIMVCGEFTNKALKNNIYLELYNKNLFLPTSNVGNVSYLQRVFLAFLGLDYLPGVLKLVKLLTNAPKLFRREATSAVYLVRISVMTVGSLSAFCSLGKPLEHPVDLELI